MFGKLGGFVGETKQELKKVAWPNKQELWQSTLVVIITTFILAAYIGVVDLCLSSVMRLILR